MTTIYTGNTTTTGFVINSDTTGNLILKTGGGVPAITADNTGNVMFHNTITGNVNLDNVLQQPIPVFKAYRTADYGATNSSFLSIAYNAVLFDNYNGFDTGNYRYTVPITGYYLFDYGLLIDGTNITEIQARLVAGSNDHRSFRLLTAGYTLTTSAGVGWSGISHLCFVEAGQFVRAEYFCAANSGLQVKGGQYNTYLAGHMVSRA